MLSGRGTVENKKKRAGKKGIMGDNITGARLANPAGGPNSRKKKQFSGGKQKRKYGERWWEREGNILKKTTYKGGQDRNA